MESNKLNLEASLMVALFKATMSQSYMLLGELKQKPKQEFLKFQRMGNSMIDTFEKSPTVNIEYIEELEEIIHEILNGIRKQQNK